MPSSDLLDISEFQNLAKKSSSTSITIEEIAFVLFRACPHKAPSPDSILMYSLLFFGKLLFEFH
jgi:hypothetical protein